jgi:branched-chain amino acid transport system ATP-binding protein
MLKTRGVTKHFGGLYAVRGLDVEIEEGAIVGLIGPNGAGKTTFFNLVSGFFHPDEGQISFSGRDVTYLQPYQICRLGVGRTFQIPRPFAHVDVLTNVTVASLNHTRSVPVARRLAAETLEFVGLWPKHTSLASTLTISDRKRLEVARALATQPRLLLLDEVMAGLNPGELQAMIDLARQINQRGVTLLLIEHLMAVIMSLSQKVIVLHHGEKIAEGTPQAVASSASVIQAYLGEGYMTSA